MLNEVSDGAESSATDETVGYVVEATLIDGRDGFTGWTGSRRSWYHASTNNSYEQGSPRRFW